MQVKNPEIFALIETIAEHYRNNISNRYTRRALSTMSFDPGTWSLIEELTEKSANYRYQGYHLDELYLQVLALARFIYEARKQVGPNLRQLSAFGSAKPSESDRVIRDMAIVNFGANLKILADKVDELYVKIAAIDKEAAGGQPPVYARLPELREMGRYLVDQG